MIPKIIHQYWNTGSPPQEFQEYCHDWQDLHPTWSYLRWSDDSIRNILTNSSWVLWNRAHEISPRAIAQFKSDVIRYFLLYQFGGVWIDIDIQPQKPIDDLCNNSGWACWEEDDKWINNAIIAFPQNSEAIRRLLIELPISVLKHEKSTANTVKSGPQFITPLLKDKIVVYPSSYFFPYTWKELHRESEEFPNAYGIHRWNNRRSRKV